VTDVAFGSAAQRQDVKRTGGEWSVGEEHDKYWKLKPAPPPVDEELCSCEDDGPIVLQPHLSSNPLACIRCNLEMPPERVGFPESLAEQLCFWQSFHDCFFHLWLDSAEFEFWAKAQLENPKSPVNRRGIEVVQALNEYRRTYYWWFEDVGDDDFMPHACCPVCGGDLQKRYGRRLCERCSVLIER
jgi:hypothetical protein